ncbi:MAG: glycosyltransferase family 2 protein [Candidatus Moraniibacteriota bacterium]|nr:MAG: glycosyltransferase family 2 protein [Candidatus Moranbacteria bacterium]
MNPISQTPKKNDDVFIVIPAYNEASVIASVVLGVHAEEFPHVLVVDDGSPDNTAEEAKKAGAHVVRHSVNRGKGAATKTGIEAAKILKANIIVTFDGDGQHDPKDLPAMIEPIRRGRAHVVLGTRLRDPSGMPLYKILHNQLGNLFVWMLYGLWVSDSQSGFRAYSRIAAHTIDTKTDRYEYESEVIYEIRKHRLKFCEVPIQVRYTEYSLGKVQKQSFLVGIKTALRLLFHTLK